MMGGMIWLGLLWLAAILGFAYIIWVLAIKENGALKLTGQIIAAVIAVLAIVILVTAAVYCGRLGGLGQCGMMGNGTMMMDGGKMKMEMMHKMMKDGKMSNDMKQMMEKMMKK